MKKSCLGVMLSFVLCLLLVVPVNASGEDYERLVDEADLLSNSEEDDLLELLDDISKDHDCDVVIVAVDDMEDYGYSNIVSFVDDYYDFCEYEDDGIIFLLSMEERDWAISTKGFGIEAFTDDGQDYIMDQVLPSLSDGDYADAFTEFANQCDKFLTQAEEGDPYDGSNMPKEPLGLIWIPGSFLIGCIISLIIVMVMKGQLKSVKMQSGAADYVKKNSLKIDVSRDIYLYRNVSRRLRPKDTGSGGGGSSTHRSSSGSSHGGSHGKF